MTTFLEFSKKSLKCLIFVFFLITTYMLTFGDFGLLIQNFHEEFLFIGTSFGNSKLPEANKFVQSENGNFANNVSSSIGETSTGEQSSSSNSVIGQTSELIYRPDLKNCKAFLNYIEINGYSISGCNGRLGNQLGVLALGLAINLQFGIKLVFNPWQRDFLSSAIYVQEMCKYDGSTFCLVLPKKCRINPPADKRQIVQPSTGMIWEKGVAAFGESPEDLKGKRVQLPTYPQFLPLVTYGFYAEFRSRVIFNRTVWRDAEKVFNGLNKLNNCWTQTGCTVVYVHMRMGDYKYHLNALQWDCDVFEKTNYLQDAFKKVATLYKKPMFYIVGYSDKDVDNFFHTHKEEFSPYHYKLVAPYEREMLPHRRTKSYQGIDLALLAMSEVLILSYGSYGDFGALLGRDKKHVLYPGKHKAHDETGVNLGLPHFLPIPWNITETERTK